MSQWHPPADIKATAANWRVKVVRWGAIHAPSFVATDRLRRLILAASGDIRFSIARSEFLGVVTLIDEKGRGR